MRLRIKQTEHGIAMEGFYGLAGISRQGLHKGIKAYEAERKMMTLVKASTDTYRREKDRRAGSRSVFHNLDIKRTQGIGVTKFEQLMSEYGLVLAPLRVRVITTQSSLQSWNYSNLTNGLEVLNINQLVVGDLTYIAWGKDKFYLFCLTDVYSGRIVGHCLSQRMRSIEAKIAFDKWIALRGKSALQGCIHHTDGGSQYFSATYLRALTELKVQISVAENCLQNGYAEQRNGFIKYHLLPTVEFKKGVNLCKEIERILNFYNLERKQAALKWKSPNEYEQLISALTTTPKLVLYDWNGSR